MGLFSSKQEQITIDGTVLRAGTTKDPSISPSHITLLLDSELDKCFRMQSWAYPLEVSGTMPGDRVSIGYTLSKEGEPKVWAFINHTYRQQVLKQGEAISFD